MSHKRALVVSGGGSKGAFAVGAIEVLLSSGLRFDLVTGTSTGALIAPLIATDDIALLRHIYSTVHTQDILAPRSALDCSPQVQCLVSRVRDSRARPRQTSHRSHAASAQTSTALGAALALTDIAAHGASTDQASGSPAMQRVTVESLRDSVTNLQNPPTQRVLLSAIDFAGTASTSATAALESVQHVQLPIGWRAREDAALLTASPPTGHTSAKDALDPWAEVAQPILGLLVTVFAVMLGAPFWFDVLNHLSTLRATQQPSQSTIDTPTRERPDEMRARVQQANAGATSGNADNRRASYIAPTSTVDGEDEEQDRGELSDEELNTDEELPPATGGRGVSAVLQHAGLGADRCAGHKEYAPRRKVDPSFDMPAFRSRVAQCMVAGSLDREVRNVCRLLGTLENSTARARTRRAPGEPTAYARVVFENATIHGSARARRPSSDTQFNPRSWHAPGLHLLSLAMGPAMGPPTRRTVLG